MENTAFCTRIPLPNEMVERLRPTRRSCFMVFRDNKLRPPVMDEMLPDLFRVIAALAQKYCDSTTPYLQFDELMSEGKRKLAELNTRGIVDSAEDKPKCPSRDSFFRYFKGAVNNHFKSRVQKYRYTEKRTGQKPPPRGYRLLPGAEEYHKNVDLSLDDPDLNLQVSDQGHHEEIADKDIRWGFSDVSAEYAHLLTPVEKLVFHELISPGGQARCEAELDASRKANQSRISIKIKRAHMASSVGLDEKLFEEAVLSIQQKIKAYRMLTEEQQDQAARRNAILAQLKQLFGLQIPSEVDDMVVRRMLTMAARHQFDKVNSQVGEMLTEVGAKVPRSIGGTLGSKTAKIACYGVLYQKNCRECNMCDYRHSCQMETANAGLVNIVQSRRLLGSTQPRTPAFLPRTSAEIAAPITSADEAEIINHLDETFEKTKRDGQIFYYHVVDNKRRLVICVENSSPLKLRFCNPSPDLKKRLVGKQKTWFPRDGAPRAEVLDLIEQHGKETFE